jgi:hypothetical protein
MTREEFERGITTGVRMTIGSVDLAEFEHEKLLVEATLRDHSECDALSEATRHELIADLTHAVLSTHAGVPAKRKEGSGAAWARGSFVRDIMCAMHKANLPTGNWRDSLLHKLIADLAPDTGLKFPVELIDLVNYATSMS